MLVYIRNWQQKCALILGCLGCLFINVKKSRAGHGDLSPLKRPSFCHFKLPGGVLLAQIQPLLYQTACIVGVENVKMGIGRT